MKKTSIETYKKIIASGLLSKRRREVYDFVYHNEPCTIRSVVHQIGGGEWQSYSPRFSELEKMGVIEVVGETKSHKSGQQVSLYATTGKFPKLIKSKKKRKENGFEQVYQYMLENEKMILTFEEVNVLRQK